MICPCGCGVEFTPKDQRHRYANGVECRKRWWAGEYLKRAKSRKDAALLQDLEEVEALKARLGVRPTVLGMYINVVA